MATNIGMMDSAYFVGRSEILTWINSILQLNLSKVEEGCSGAVHCQLMDAVHPGIVPMHRVNFDAKNEYDMIQNYKVLQDVFNKLKITKVDFLIYASRHIEVNKLVKGRPLDNLEFMQWLKRYCDSVNGRVLHGYNPLERREASKGGKDVNKKSTSWQPSTRSSTAAPKTQTSHNTRRNDVNTTNQSVKASRPSSSGGPAYNEQVLEIIDVMRNLQFKNFGGLNLFLMQIAELKLSVDSLEKERDFYFAKLRDIEILCQCPEIENLAVVEAIKRILYATDDSTSVVAEAQAMISQYPKKPQLLSPISEVPEDVPKSDNQKRKNIINVEVDSVANTMLSPRQRISDASDVHCSGSPLVTY
ncbi:hypothetical protein HYC85_002571 [Camellia sinensis]|uniref:Calponin-homology (CH) domain-containing protein n=1 Tax=Camellia sinensis TaxID=4442 RepID=A0A7J7I8R3_CAMSI|nr:hypothetical protein HYC85_002571 [Camellia sinensis]